MKDAFAAAAKVAARGTSGLVAQQIYGSLLYPQKPLTSSALKNNILLKMYALGARVYGNPEAMSIREIVNDLQRFCKVRRIPVPQVVTDHPKDSVDRLWINIFGVC